MVLWIACTALFVAQPANAVPPGWRVYPANLRIAGGERVTRIAFPPESAAGPAAASSPQAATGATIPIGGFQPFLAILANGDTTPGPLLQETTAPVYTAPNPASYLVANPADDYVMGILDTGAPLHIINENDYFDLGLDPFVGCVSSSVGSATLFNGEPFGIFFEGLGAIDPATNLLTLTNMKGQSNVSVAFGDCPAMGGIPNVAGTPLTMFYCVEIHNDDWRFVRRNGNRFFGPSVTFSEPQPEDPGFPCGQLDHRIPLTFTPANTDFAFYFFFPDLQFCQPTLVGGDPASRLFISTRFNHGPNQLNAIPMVLDTGAQIGFVSTVIAGDLGLPLVSPDFIVDVQGVCDVSSQVPGFFLDMVSFPTCNGPRLEFQRVPVLVRNFAGVNGLIGMNVFDDRNLRLCGGTFNPDLFLTNDAYLEVSDPLGFSPCDLTRDGTVNDDEVAIFREVFNGPGADTLFLPADLDEDFDSDLDDWAILSAKLDLAACDKIPAAIEVVAEGPVDLLVTDPLGNRVSNTFDEILGGAWVEFDIDTDTIDEDVVQIVSPETGGYTITVIPEPGALGTDLYSLQVAVNGNLTILATDVQISQIPGSPYAFFAGATVPAPAISAGGWLAMVVLLMVAGAIVLRRQRHVP
jgi:hypothetical protein